MSAGSAVLNEWELMHYAVVKNILERLLDRATNRNPAKAPATSPQPAQGKVTGDA
jgi:hypothetical protein